MWRPLHGRSCSRRRCFAGTWPAGYLLIVPYHDSLRYARLRGGAILPRMRRFEIGDYVYYRNTSARTALDPEAKPEILRMVEVRPTGVMVLEGRCGSQLKAHVWHWLAHVLPQAPVDAHPRGDLGVPSVYEQWCEQGTGTGTAAQDGAKLNRALALKGAGGSHGDAGSYWPWTSQNATAGRGQLCMTTGQVSPFSGGLR
ncbi:hypothetical protein Vafri_16218 [Volvox africanus]|uniref:Uncharacterized protein n=1 Tax=Volvox africanus TaxID=51714 RepID=A0A8J4BIN9_9CHLO|nr:hypothetical protein Vafri_16218 [Volvox africanus]